MEIGERELSLFSSENSPAFQRWKIVPLYYVKVPSGTKEPQPS